MVWASGPKLTASWHIWVRVLGKMGRSLTRGLHMVERQDWSKTRSIEGKVEVLAPPQSHNEEQFIITNTMMGHICHFQI